MYEALGLALKMNDGPEADRKKAFNYAADLAQQSHNPNHLTSVADRLFLEGYLERVGPLLDEAMPKVPHRVDPIIMSINLAQKTKDPVRMADSVDRLLSLGWPGRDEYFRIEAGGQVERMVKQLRAENKIAEAELLQKKFEESSSRDVFVRLTWDGYADFDLSVAEPLRRDRRLRHAAHRLRRGPDQKRIRQAPGRRSTSALAGLTASTRYGSPTSGPTPSRPVIEVDARNHHPRGNRSRTEADAGT